MKTSELMSLCRELKGLTIRDVEKATGLSNAFISQIENDKCELGFRTAVILCRFYNITLDRLAATLEDKP